MATPQELINIVNANIIDNNTGYINPARMRSVLIAIIESIPTTTGGGGLTLNPLYPLVLNGFDGSLILKSVPLRSFERIMKGWKPGFAPTNDNRNIEDYDQPGDFFWGTDSDGRAYVPTRWNGEGDKNDVANHIWGYRSSLFFEGEPGYEE